MAFNRESSRAVIYNRESSGTVTFNRVPELWLSTERVPELDFPQSSRAATELLDHRTGINSKAKFKASVAVLNVKNYMPHTAGHCAENC